MPLALRVDELTANLLLERNRDVIEHAFREHLEEGDRVFIHRNTCRVVEYGFCTCEPLISRPMVRV